MSNENQFYSANDEELELLYQQENAMIYQGREGFTEEQLGKFVVGSLERIEVQFVPPTSNVEDSTNEYRKHGVHSLINDIIKSDNPLHIILVEILVDNFEYSTIRYIMEQYQVEQFSTLDDIILQQIIDEFKSYI